METIQPQKKSDYAQNFIYIENYIQTRCVEAFTIYAWDFWNLWYDYRHPINIGPYSQGHHMGALEILVALCAIGFTINMDTGKKPIIKKCQLHPLN